MTNPSDENVKRQVELITRLVLERLRGDGTRATADRDMAVGQPSSPCACDEGSGAGPVSLTSRLVTMEVLRAQLGAARSIVLRHDAIVTPAARDEMRERGITVRRDGDVKTADGPRVRLANRQRTGIRVFACGDSACRSAAEVLARQLRAKRIEPASTTRDIVQAIAGSVTAGQRGIWLTGQPHEALWRLHSAGIRAARCIGKSDVIEASDKYAAAVYVIDGRCGLSDELVSVLVGMTGQQDMS